jgi:hypothetical protein
MAMLLPTFRLVATSKCASRKPLQQISKHLGPPQGGLFLRDARAETRLAAILAHLS